MQQEYQSALSLLSDEGFMNTGTLTETSCKLEWVSEGGEKRRGGERRESGPFQTFADCNVHVKHFVKTNQNVAICNGSMAHNM